MDEYQEILAALAALTSNEERIAFALQEGIIVPRRGTMIVTGPLALTEQEVREANGNSSITIVRTEVTNEQPGGMATGTVEYVYETSGEFSWAEAQELRKVLSTRKYFRVTRKLIDESAFYVPSCDCGWGPRSVGHEWVRATSVPTVVVTRHAGLVEYLMREGHVGPGVRMIGHATPDDVRGAHVWGVLPLHLAALAFKVSTVDMDIPPDLRGKELSVEDVYKYTSSVSTYSVATK